MTVDPSDTCDNRAIIGKCSVAMKLDKVIEQRIYIEKRCWAMNVSGKLNAFPSVRCLCLVSQRVAWVGVHGFDRRSVRDALVAQSPPKACLVDLLGCGLSKVGCKLSETGPYFGESVIRMLGFAGSCGIIGGFDERDSGRNRCGGRTG